MYRFFLMPILVVLCLNLGCAGFSQYRKDKIAERSQATSSFQVDDLWKQGYGFNNPNPDRKKQGLEPLNFDGSTNDRGFFDTLVTDMLGHALESAAQSAFKGAGRLLSR